MEASSFRFRPCHARSKSSPTPPTAPWADCIPSSPSMIVPCGSADLSGMCGFGETLQGMMMFAELHGGSSSELEHDNTTRGTTLLQSKASFASSGKASSEDLLAAAQVSASPREMVHHHHHHHGDDDSQSHLAACPVTPVYQKRGRFTIWPVTAAAPFPFFGMAPQ